ncbi:hypothetical protein HK405_003890 [Cladochytrium tenue]|nr:hypothetical protein HK405_003890 [Cladochytrium tenue]
MLLDSPYRDLTDFVLNSAEQNLVNGSLRPKPTPSANFSTPLSGGATASSGLLPEPATAPGAAGGGTSAFWTIEFYQQFFDVDTNDVLQRMLESLLPRGKFMEAVGSNPDLYGPFWISTTVIFALFVTSTIAGSIYAYIHGTAFAYDVTLLTIALTTVYAYVTALPGLLWAISRYLGAPLRFFDLVDLYGYGMTVWIPVSLLCIIPSSLLRWVLIAVAFALSTFFTLQNLVPLVLTSSGGAPSPTARTAAVAVVVVAHAGLALLFRLEFFTFVADVNGSA